MSDEAKCDDSVSIGRGPGEESDYDGSSCTSTSKGARDLDLSLALARVRNCIATTNANSNMEAHQLHQVSNSHSSMTNNNNENSPNAVENVEYFSSHYLSAATMLKSGRIGDVQVLLRNEKETPIPTTAGDMNNSIINNADNSSSSIKSKRSMENYTRLALLLTQMFVNDVNEKQDQEPDSSSSRNFASTIQLGDFFIQFDREHGSIYDDIITLTGGNIMVGGPQSNIIEVREPCTSSDTKQSPPKRNIQAG